MKKSWTTYKDAQNCKNLSDFEKKQDFTSIQEYMEEEQPNYADTDEKNV